MNPIDRAKVYRFLAEAFLYPTEVWPEDLPLLADILEVVGLREPSLIAAGDFNLAALQAEICVEAQRAFLRDHLAGWIGLLAEALARLGAAVPGAPGPESLYPRMARLAHRFVLADADRLGLAPEAKPLAGLRPTPQAPNLTCDACPVAS